MISETGSRSCVVLFISCCHSICCHWISCVFNLQDILLYRAIGIFQLLYWFLHTHTQTHTHLGQGDNFICILNSSVKLFDYMNFILPGIKLSYCASKENSEVIKLRLSVPFILLLCYVLCKTLEFICVSATSICQIW